MKQFFAKIVKPLQPDKLSPAGHIQELQNKPSLF